MRKILFIGMTSNHGGIETFMINVFKKLNNIYHFDFIQDNDDDLFYANEITNSGGNIFKVNVGTSYISHITRYKKACKFFKEHNDYDAVHLNAVSLNTIFWLLAAKKYGIKKLIIHSHNDRVKLNSKIKEFFTKILSMFSLIQLKLNKDLIKLAASEQAGIWMFHSKTFSIISNGVNTSNLLYSSDKSKRLKEHYGINDKKVIMTLSRIEYQKNFFKIIDIFNEISLIDNNVVLIICGEGSYKDQVLKYAEEKKLDKLIFFVGNVVDVNYYLSAADLILMPSLYEALPFSIIESQANGVRSLVSEAIPRNVNVTNKVSYLTLKKSSKEWARYADTILSYPLTKEERENMNVEIRNSKFNLDNAIQELDAIYNGGDNH